VCPHFSNDQKIQALNIDGIGVAVYTFEHNSYVAVIKKLGRKK